VQLFQVVVDLADDGGVADVGVDLALAGHADAHRLQAFGEVDRVGRHDHAAAADLVADQLRVEVLARGDESHRVGDDALAGGFHLRHGNGLSQTTRVQAGSTKRTKLSTLKTNANRATSSS